MTIIFADGFETGDISRWTTSTGTPTVVSTPVHHGVYSLQCDCETAENVRTSITAVNRINGRLYLLFTGFPTTATEHFSFLYLRDASFNPIFRLGIMNVAGVINWYLRYDANFQLYAPSPALAINTWYGVEGEYNIDTDVHNMWVDGNLIISESFATAATCAGVYNGTPDRTSTNIDHVIEDCIVYADRYIGTEFTYFSRHRSSRTGTRSRNVQMRRNDPNPRYPNYPPRPY